MALDTLSILLRFSFSWDIQHKTGIPYNCLIAFIVSAIVVAATAAMATAAIVDSVQTAHTVDVLLTNTTLEMIQQALIDQEILTRLSTVESALNWIGEQQDTLVTHQQLTCDPGFSKLCITPLQWNSSQHSWNKIQHHIRGVGFY